MALSDGEVFHFFVFGIRVGVHLREDCHHLVDAPDNIAISIANKIMHYNKVVAIFAKGNTDVNAKDEEMKYFSVRKGYTISCYYELPEMFIPYDAPFLIAR